MSFAVFNRLEILLTSADIHSMLHTMTEHRLPIHDIRYIDPLHIRFTVSPNDYDFLSSLCAKRGDTLEILHHQGLLHILLGLLKRPVLIIGLLCIVILSSLLPTRVLFVRVEGNTSIPTNLILDQAERCGISFGASCRNIRNDRVKNALLSAIPQLQWVGINTYGCVAIISVQEGSAQNEMQENGSISTIVAKCDAVIQKITVQEGNLLCSVGQAVSRGQVLVSPYTDCGICIRLSGTKAEIYGETQRQLTIISPTEFCKRVASTGRTKKYALIIGKKRINFFKGSGISGGTCAKIYEEKYMTLPGGYILPIGIACEEYITYELLPADTSAEESWLIEFSEDYLLHIMQAGRIQASTHVYTTSSQYTRLDSGFRCLESIGITHPEEGIIDHE